MPSARWANGAPQGLFAACSWAVCTRPPLLEGRLDHWLPEIVRDDFEVSEDGREARHRLAPTRIELIEIEPVDISASELRTALAAGRTDIARWLPAAARDAILSSGCYTRGAVSNETPPPSQETPPMSELDRVAKARLLAEAALELKAEDPVVLDMREVSSFADTFVILSGRSDRHVRSVAEAVIDAIKQAGEDLLGSEGLDDGQWVLIDSNDVVIHVFDPEAREHFDLERLWADAPRLDLVEDLGLDLELAEPA